MTISDINLDFIQNNSKLIELKEILMEDAEIFLNYYQEQNKNINLYNTYLDFFNSNVIKYLEEYKATNTLGEIAKFIAEDFEY
jgi:hypothetical protein